MSTPNAPFSEPQMAYLRTWFDGLLAQMAADRNSISSVGATVQSYDAETGRATILPDDSSKPLTDMANETGWPLNAGDRVRFHIDKPSGGAIRGLAPGTTPTFPSTMAETWGDSPGNTMAPSDVGTFELYPGSGWVTPADGKWLVLFTLNAHCTAAGVQEISLYPSGGLLHPAANIAARSEGGSDIARFTIPYLLTQDATFEDAFTPEVDIAIGAGSPSVVIDSWFAMMVCVSQTLSAVD